MNAETVILGAHAGATVCMVGVIWTCQLVHYPMMSLVPAERFIAYEAEHMRRISWIVGPAMVAELGCAVWLAVRVPAGVGGLAAWGMLGALAVIWLSTAALQGPMHGRLARGYDAGLIARLVATNWVRTVAWTARGVGAVWMLAVSGRGA